MDDIKGLNTNTEIKDFLKAADPVLGGLIDRIGDMYVQLQDNYFEALASSIIGQQLSPKAASTIRERAKSICGEFTPESVVAASTEQLRAAGLSGSKISYMKDLAERAVNGQIILSELPDMESGQLLETLTAVKGIGKWTAEMFMIFTLGKEDIFSLGDLGLRRAIMWLYDLDFEPDAEYLTRLTDKWRPYRSIASLYLWEAIDSGFVANRERNEAVKNDSSSDIPAGCMVQGEGYLDVIPRGSFNFDECLVYLGRSANESTHFIEDGCLYKAVELGGEKLVLKIYSSAHGYLRVEVLNGLPEQNTWNLIFLYVWEWFDLGRNLKPFYSLADKDKVLKKVVRKHIGLRIIGIHDIFEALAWAVAGQQINLAFAYTLKKRLVEKYGEAVEHAGRKHWLFPKAETIAALDVSDLTELQFTGRKAEYIIGIAEAAASGAITKEMLEEDGSLEKQRKRLVAIRGVGKWTADYAIMKCIKNTEAFPVGDVGLQNAIKQVLVMDRKPTAGEIVQLASGWKGWEAYATFYLWRSLYE